MHGIDVFACYGVNSLITEPLQIPVSTHIPEHARAQSPAICTTVGLARAQSAAICTTVSLARAQSAAICTTVGHNCRCRKGIVYGYMHISRSQLSVSQGHSLRLYAQLSVTLSVSRGHSLRIYAQLSVSNAVDWYHIYKEIKPQII